MRFMCTCTLVMHTRGGLRACFCAWCTARLGRQRGLPMQVLAGPGSVMALMVTCLHFTACWCLQGACLVTTAASVCSALLVAGVLEARKPPWSPVVPNATQLQEPSRHRSASVFQVYRGSSRPRMRRVMHNTVEKYTVPFLAQHNWILY